MKNKKKYTVVWLMVFTFCLGTFFVADGFAKRRDQVKRQVSRRPLTKKSKILKRPMPALLKKTANDPDEASVPNQKDFRQIALHVNNGHLYTDIFFYDNMNLSGFYYYFSTDTDGAAEILVRCNRNNFEVAKETRPGLHDKILYKGTPVVSGNKYSLRFPWTPAFGIVDKVDLWLYCMDGKDRLPDSGHVALSWWSLVNCAKKESSLYQGIVSYKSTPARWWMRCDGVVQSNSSTFFPQINVRNPEVTRLLAAIGCPPGVASSDAEIWKRTVRVWKWLQSKQLSSTHPNFNAAKNYISGLGHWPALFEIAHMYVSYGGIWWGTCMSRAQLFATLLYAVGIPPNRFTIAEAYWKAEYSQHMYVIVYVKGRWRYLDPSSISQPLSYTSITSVGTGSADYVHPLKIKLLPGSKIWGVPLVK